MREKETNYFKRQKKIKNKEKKDEIKGEMEGKRVRQSSD